MAEQPHNQTDSQGRKQGYWEETGRLGETGKGLYVDDLRQGLWKAYNSNGTLWWENHYLNGELHGIHKRYRLDSDGAILYEATYLNGKVHGTRKKYYDDGTLESETLYQNDLRQGPFKDYHTNGNTHHEGQYVDDLKQGIWKTYWTNKQLHIESPYLDGMLHGVIWNYNRDGTLHFFKVMKEDTQIYESLPEEAQALSRIIPLIGLDKWSHLDPNLILGLHLFGML